LKTPLSIPVVLALGGLMSPLSLANPIVVPNEKLPEPETPPPRALPPTGVRPTLRAVQAEQVPVIDGVLNDEAWSLAEPTETFRQVQPLEGATPTERTEMRLLFDSGHLYIAIRCFDSDPAAIVARQMLREGDINGDDIVEIAVEPFGDQRNGYYFALSAAGAKVDGLIETQTRSIRTDWDELWIGKVTIDDAGWSAEFAIPLTSISLNPSIDRWGFNAQRTIRRKQEIVRWSGASPNIRLADLNQAGTVTDLRRLDQGRGITFKPFVSARIDTDRGGLELRPGFDLFYKITPSTTGVLTVNTDFAEAEVDDRRVNLTRFPIFFPEKRAFFLQDSSVFGFGGIFNSPTPFYSRRIGLVRGQVKDILAGVKVTGRESNLNFGLLSVEMYDDADLGPKNLSVARLSANVFDESTVGLIATNGDPATTGQNTLIGGDVNFRNSEFLGDKVLEAHAWAMGTFSSAGAVRTPRDGPPTSIVPRGTEQDDGAVGGRVSMPNDDWLFSLYGARSGRDFRPALGFVSRTGVYEVNSAVRRRWRPNTAIRRIDVRVDNELFYNLDGTIQSKEWELPSVTVETQTGEQFSVEYLVSRDRPDRAFNLTDGVFIPAGDYRFNTVVGRIEGSDALQFTPAYEFAAGDFYDGRRTDHEIEMAWKPSRHFTGSVVYEQSDIDLPDRPGGGSFIVRVLQTRAVVAFSPELTWTTVVQWDSDSDNAGLNSRVRYEPIPGRELFVVFSQGFDVEDDRRLTTTSSALTVKLGLTFRF
jgi:hypothetical protein